jgi:GntR family transcriptional repressor for pyruvate dehydrogenase complex
MLEPASKVTLFDDVILQIQRLIQNGDLKPGDQLPSERDLARQLGVSRNTLREALKALKLVGVLEMHQGGGTFINEDINERLIASSFRFLALSEVQEILDLLEARKALEVATTYVAAKKAGKEEIEALEQSVDAMRRNINDLALCSQFDLEFHSIISVASQNVFLIELQKGIRDPLLRAMKKTMHLDKTVRRALEYHEEILTAIKNREPDLAKDAMRRHLISVEKDLKKMAQRAEVFP